MRPMLALLCLAASLNVAAASDPDEKLICVYDPMGTNGPVYNNAKNMLIEAAGQGVKIRLRADVEERTAAEDLVAGKCDGALLTGVETRKFGLASATIEAIGALPDYALLRTALGYLRNAKFDDDMRTGEYETGGVFPGGAVLLYSRDKTWTRTEDLAGKSVAVIGNDVAALTMAEMVGLSPKTASTATFGAMFNSHSVDAVYAPAVAYEPIELYRGLSDGGGIVDFPITQLTFQLVLRADRFPEGFGSWSRGYAYSQFDAALTAVRRAEAKIAKHLINIPKGDKAGYADKFRDVRVKLLEDGVYDAKVLKLMLLVRCRADGARAECASSKESQG